MKKDLLTPEHVRRRIVDNLERAKIFQDHARSTENKDPLKTKDSTPNMSDYQKPSGGLVSKVKKFLVERLLPRLNLTSYNSLRRAQTVIDEFTHVVAEKDHTLQELTRAIGERDQRLQELDASVGEKDQSILHLNERLNETTRQQDNLQSQLAEIGARYDQFRIEVKGWFVQMLGTLNYLQTHVGRVKLEQLTVGLEEDYFGVAAIQRELVQYSALQEARLLIQEHYAAENDPNLQRLFDVYERAITRQLPYWDIRAAARAAAKILNPQTYLEVGTRRGWSLAQVLVENPDVQAYIFEMWLDDYGGVSQGSPEYIMEKMGSVVGSERTLRIEFISGNSHDTLPEFFAGEIKANSGSAPQKFDLIAVDGDHSRLGAWWDLYDLFPRVKVGGAIIFDDLEYAGDEDAGNITTSSKYERPPLPDYLTSLLDVWLHMQSLYPNFIFFSSPRLKFRAGIAIRLH